MARNRLAPAVAAFAALSLAAHGHSLEDPAAAGAPFAWNLEAWLLALLLLSAGAYALGLWRLWTQAGRGRGIAQLQAASFAVGWMALVVALVSPLDALGNHLFSAHMVQHELLMVVAAPLLVLGRPLAAWTWSLPPAQRRRIGGWLQAGGWQAFWGTLTAPLAAWALHALALWAWHVPVFFNAALRDEGLHIAQHFAFLGTALLFWWAVLGHDPRGRFGAGHSAAYLFTTMLHTGALGALLTVAPTPWYSAYTENTTALGFDPLQDQQLGGLVMWVPSGVAYVIAALWVLGRMLTRVRA